VPAEAAGDAIGLCALRDGRRVVLAGGYALTTVAAALHSATGDLVLSSATQGSEGDLGESFVASGGAVGLAEGDSLILTYHASDSPLDSAGSWYVTAERAGASGFSSRPSRPSGSTLPTRFALRQNQPNPFANTTLIRFDLPVASNVRLEVFDAQGRRIQTVANGAFPAGYHAVRWEPSRSAAGRLGPGVYFYRIQAGTFRDRRKMVLVGS
jgi:hypothetical protein